MPKILSANSIGTCRLNICLDNGNIVILDLSEKLKTTRFRQLLKPELFAHVKTDGERVFWNGLTELSFDEIFEMVQQEMTDTKLKKS